MKFGTLNLKKEKKSWLKAYLKCFIIVGFKPFFVVKISIKPNLLT